MAQVSYGELRNRLASYMDAVRDSGEPLLVTRQNVPNVVIMSEQDYEGLIGTVHLLKSPANAARLLRSIEDADRGKLKKRESPQKQAKPRHENRMDRGRLAGLSALAARGRKNPRRHQ
jgi:antitoxin YefM